MKDYFILYSSYEDKFKTLKDKDRGRLIMALFAFNDGRDLSSTLSKSALVVYNFITNQIAIDTAKYNRTCERNKQNAMKRWQKDNDNSQIIPNNATASKNNASAYDRNATASNELCDRINEQCDRIKPPQNADATALNGICERINVTKNADATALNGTSNKLTNITNKLTSLVSSKEKNIFNNYTACAHARVGEKSIEERKPFKKFFKDIFDYCFTDKFIKPANEIIDIMIEAFNQAKTSSGLKFKQTTYNANKLLEAFTKVDSDKLGKIINQITFNENIENRPFYILGSLISASQNPKCNNTPEQIEQLYQDLKINPYFN